VDGVAAHAVHEDQDDPGEEREGKPGAPVQAPEHDQDAEQEQDVADDLDDELGEEVGQGGDVAVDALDQLAGGAGLMERQVESQAVQGEVSAQRVGGGPAEALAGVGGADGERLLDEGEGDEQPG
jgi:hypothetical protein